jgi:hypothetical protein
MDSRPETCLTQTRNQNNQIEKQQKVSILSNAKRKQFQYNKASHEEPHRRERRSKKAKNKKK